MAFNKTKRDFLKIAQDLMDAVYFFDSATVCVKESFIAIIYRREQNALQKLYR